jgi:hypothetical protein
MLQRSKFEFASNQGIRSREDFYYLRQVRYTVSCGRQEGQEGVQQLVLGSKGLRRPREVDGIVRRRWSLLWAPRLILVPIII